MNSTYAQKSSTVQKAADTKAASVLDSSAQSESLQRKADMANNATQRAEAPRPNNTGMPDNLKAGIESLSGFSMDNVRVHYNSSKPATVQALAYTQGTDIHVAPGQEKCLPHEAWHVAQQMAGRVSPTTNINGMPVNDNAALEHEADVMGEKAVQCKKDVNELCLFSVNQSEIVQRDPDPLVNFYEQSHTEIKDGKEIAVDDYAIEGGGYKDCGSLHIAFETFGDNESQLIDLYNRVIKEYNGKATVVIGINVEAFLGSVVRNGYYESVGAYRKKLKVDPNQKADAVNVSAITKIPDRLSEKVDKLKSIKPALNHKIIICPFVYDGRYNQGGGYNMPYCEIRKKLMEVASLNSATLYRWIDRDCRDDSSIKAFNEGLSFKGLGNCFVSAAYDWRVEKSDFQKLEKKLKKFIPPMVELVNDYEHKARCCFFNIREKMSLTGTIDGDQLLCKYYLPETTLYMSDDAHKAAKNQLASVLKKTNEGQSRESEHATLGSTSSLRFMGTFRCSKPLKHIGEESSYLSSLETILPPNITVCPKIDVFLARMKELRQTIFDGTSWYFLNEVAQQEWEIEKDRMLREMFIRYCYEVLPREMTGKPQK